MAVSWSVLLGLAGCGDDTSDLGPQPTTTTAEPDEEPTDTNNTDEDPSPDERLVSAPCPYEVPASLADVTECFTFAAADGITVPVARVAATATDSSVPVVLQNGGPGASPWDGMVATITSPVGVAMRSRSDIVVVETRGSRYATPSLECEGLFEANQAVLDGGQADPNAVIEGCFETIRDEGIDLGDFDSLDLSEDIAAVMTALGADEFNYYGVSFGTIIGQHLLRDHDDRLGRIVLDSVAALGTDSIDSMPFNADQALDAIATACEAEAACTAGYGDVRALVNATLESLDATPLSLQVPDPNGGTRTVSIDGDRLAELFWSGLYANEVAEFIPLLALGVRTPEVQAVLADLFVAQGINNPHAIPYYPGLSLASHCGDNRTLAPDFTGPDATAFGRRVGLGTPLDSICEMFGLAALPDDKRAPVKADTPVLLLAGNHDPVTPPAWAESVAEGLSQGVAHTVRGVGHGVIASACGEQAILAFLDGA
ncbi:MAG: alpha/beta hydrolase, partial [Myxococcota bacterium]